MNRRSRTLLTALGLAVTTLAAVGLTTALVQDEDHDHDRDRDERVTVVQLDQVPRAVQDAFRTLAAGAAPSRVERIIDDNLVTFEFEFPKNGATASVTLSEHGDTVEIENPVRGEALPQAVRAAIEEEYPGAAISEANSVQVFYYEVELKTGGRTHEIKVLPTGDIEDEHADRDRDEDEHGNRGARHEENEEDEDDD